MKLSKKPRHWIVLVITLIALVAWILQVLDFSGEPAPHWRRIVLALGSALAASGIILNLALDKRAKEGKTN